jgi:hypothetical protein
MRKSTERVRRHRARRRREEVCLCVEAPIHELADLLVETVWLEQWDSDDRAAIQRALNRAVLALISGEL